MILSRGTVIRRESAEDRSGVRSVNEAAFGRPDEADLVEKLHAEGAVIGSLVAELSRQIAGHILFSRMWIDTAERPIPAAALAPLAVLPGWQRQGIGERLVRSGLDLLREQREKIVIVLGHPEYYPRFGFSCDKARALDSPFPPHAFMAMELAAGALEGVRGKVRYPASFGIEG
jgi:putative acetyltransferase